MYSFHHSRESHDGLSTQFSYHCRQAGGAWNDNEKKLTVNEENQRDVRRMECFECHGLLCITSHGDAADVTIHHQQSHKPYVSIALPDKWRTFIGENHRMGPAKVCV